MGKNPLNITPLKYWSATHQVLFPNTVVGVLGRLVKTENGAASSAGGAELLR